jgi:hypothetical protein
VLITIFLPCSIIRMHIILLRRFQATVYINYASSVAVQGLLSISCLHLPSLADNKRQIVTFLG